MRNIEFFVIPLILFWAGCTQVPPADSLVCIDPILLDFGKVRPTDLPISLSFDIENYSLKPIKIIDVSSGCNCTVLDLSLQTISPKSKVSVNLKVNPFGHDGKFSNKVRIAISDHIPLWVEIQGTIAADVWSDGQAIRCTILTGEKVVSTTFALYTKDYPDIVFDTIDVPENMAVEEISRTIRGDETIITFSLTIYTQGEENISHILTIKPVDKSISPLSLPVYCYCIDLEH